MESGELNGRDLCITREIELPKEFGFGGKEAHDCFAYVLHREYHSVEDERRSGKLCFTEGFLDLAHLVFNLLISSINHTAPESHIRPECVERMSFNISLAHLLVALVGVIVDTLFTEIRNG